MSYNHPKYHDNILLLFSKEENRPKSQLFCINALMFFCSHIDHKVIIKSEKKDDTWWARANTRSLTSKFMETIHLTSNPNEVWHLSSFSTALNGAIHPPHEGNTSCFPSLSETAVGTHLRFPGWGNPSERNPFCPLSCALSLSLSLSVSVCLLLLLKLFFSTQGGR